ncbi:DUF2027 domain-containing protein [Limibacter armeniacum]|uniref:Smr/MutS family protein n=1 Tax=Limibacter armeniacum TaxID=466084 RepID=UPI002FE5B2D3
MNIGDKVRSVSGSEEGIVVRFITEREVEVEIEDGFRIPFMKSELVIVSKEEARNFGGDDQVVTEKKGSAKEIKIPVYSEKGLFLAFTHVNDKILDLHLINNTDLTIPVLLGEESKKGYHGIYVGGLNARTHTRIHQMNLDQFESWPSLIFQALFFKAGLSIPREPLVRKLRFRAESFMKSKKEIPMLAVDGYLFQLDVEDLDKIDPDQLKSGLMENKSSEGKGAVEMPAKPKNEVDLHAEALGLDPEMGSNLISLQILHFEKELEAAIANGMDEITFIHGIGSGKLKLEIQKRLSKNHHVEYYKDAKKEKFGYGATYVKLI